MVEESDIYISLKDRQEDHRYNIAFLLIAGFLIILGLSIILKFSSPEVLAGIFGGWIAAVIGFYFMQQNVDSANRETKDTIIRAHKIVEEYKMDFKMINSQLREIQEIDRKQAGREPDPELTMKIKDLKDRTSDILRKMS